MAEALAALRAENVDALLGQQECCWLDAKGGIYQLNDPIKAEELAKDVACMANKVGGLLVVGVQTRKEQEREILDHISPVPRDLIHLTRHHEVIESRVLPPPLGVEIEWLEHDSTTGILYIHVPRQPPGRLLHAVVVPQKYRKGPPTIAVPIRVGDRTRWMEAHEMQQLLVQGFAAATGSAPAPGTQTTAPGRVVIPREDSARFAVGDGVPSLTARWNRAYQALGGALVLGEPVGEVYREGPGLAQHLSGMSESTWVLCEPDRADLVAVPGTVWEAIRTAGGYATGMDAFTALGLPWLDVTVPAEERVIDPASARVPLNEGAWGRGTLVRPRPDSMWTWEPQITRSFDITAYSGYWAPYPPDERPALRLRTLVSLPMAGADEWEIGEENRHFVTSDVMTSPLGGFITGLAAELDADTGGPRIWSPGPHGNDPWELSIHQSAVSDGEEIFTTELTVALPRGSRSAMVACVDLKLAGRGTHLSAGDLVRFFTASWATLAEVVPATVGDAVAETPWTAPPQVELRAYAEQNQGDTVDAYVDFSVFGMRQTDRQLREIGVTLTAPLLMPEDTRQREVTEAVAWTARGFGYQKASADLP